MPAEPTDSAAAEAARHRSQARGRARLRALGIDVETMTAEQVRHAYETLRQAYIDMAEAGQHMEPVRIDGAPLSGASMHSRWGMLTEAVAHFYGQHPAGWSPPRIKWPTHQERAAGVRGR